MYWQILMTLNSEHSWHVLEVLITYWKYWHIPRFTHGILRCAFDILTGNHDLYRQVLMTYTDRNSWHLLRRSRDLVRGNHNVHGRFSFNTERVSLHSDINSWQIVTDNHDILSGTHDTRHCSMADTYELGHKISGSVKYGKLPRLVKQTSASQEWLREIWGNQDTIVWGYEGA